MINKLTLIGAGLIGGSLSLSLKQAGYVAEVVAYDADQDNAQTAFALGVADQVTAARFVLCGELLDPLS